MQTARKATTNIIPTKEVIATNGTVAWLQDLYESGAILIGPDGEVSVNPEVRLAIEAMHAILAGGLVKIEIASRGGEKYDDLERTFDRAMDEVSSAHVNRGDDDVELPLAP